MHSDVTVIAGDALAAPDAAAPVLVLKVGRYVLHDHGGLGIIRSLGRLGVPVYAILEDGFTPAAFSRYLTGGFIWDARGLDVERLVQGMAVIGERLRRPAIVIPTDDVAAILLAEQAPTLRRWFVFPQQIPMLARTLANKKTLYLLCKQHGIPCPETMFPASMDEVRRFVESATFPIVVKATERHAESDRTTWIAQTPQQLYAIYGSVENERDTQLMLQEFIPHAAGEDWFYHGYRNAESGCCLSFTGRKLRSHPPFAGPTTLGKAIANQPLREQTEAFLRAISYSGITDLDYRLDKRDGRYKLLDFNPRIGAQFRLFEAWGVDVARALYLDLTGQRVPLSAPKDGRTFVVEPYDFLASVGYLRRGAMTLHEWRLSLTGPTELAWFSGDDAVPFLVLCLRLLLRVGQRLLGIKSAPKIDGGKPRYVTGLRRKVTSRLQHARMRSLLHGRGDDSYRISP